MDDTRGCWSLGRPMRERTLTLRASVVVSSMKPTLKKVSKYENKFAKLQKKAAEFNFRNQLKVVKKKEFTLEEEDKEVSACFQGSAPYRKIN
ncbi:hypothetical protein PR048_027297 [Dryococelus australis]|uniref:Troponin I n=1 Tax=Dryococelus australis TaxID=614101 RepID=A0ABQ9GF23_9NEOP|nr:hypothetical protein PR048_027297 [Dryococelus australis]